MALSLTQIAADLIHYKYLFLFPVTVIEGPIIIVIAGFFSTLGYFNPLLVFLIAIAGDVAGDTIYYAMGRWGRIAFIERWGKYVGLSVDRVKRLESHFKKHTIKTLLIGKAAYSVGTVVLVAAGIAKVPYRRFIWLNVIGTVPKSLFFLLIGIFFGQAYVKINNILEYTALVTITLAVILTIIYFSTRWLFGEINER